MKTQLFDFGSEGISLLSGHSGKGKSTILQGIYYALFGTGSKITMVGKKSSIVDLEFDDIKITRSKNPTKLVVNDVYESDEAQQIINKKFGDMFDVTGYIPQNALKSFILMNPMDKLAFLEKFAFTDVNLPGLKAKCKEHINQKYEDLIKCTARLSMITETADAMEEPELVDFPLKVKNNNYDKCIKNENIRLKNSIIRITKVNELLSILNKELPESKLIDFKREDNQTKLNELRNKKEDIQKKIDSLKVEYIGDEKLTHLKKELTLLG